MVLFDARGDDSKAMAISDFLVYELDPAHQWWAVDPGGSQEAEAIQLHSPLPILGEPHHAPPSAPTEFCPFESTKTVRLLRIF